MTHAIGASAKPRQPGKTARFSWIPGKLRLARACPAMLSALLAAASPAGASWQAVVDADARAWCDGKRARAELWEAGFSLRKIISDGRGDRWIFFGLAEAQRNLTEFMAHQLYLRLKGPMGGWNLALGRFILPFGLLAGYSSSQPLFGLPAEEVLGWDADNGLLASGIRRRWEYGLSATQGHGPHRVRPVPGPGLLAARLGISLDEDEQHVLGVSGLLQGKAPGEHDGHHGGQRCASIDLSLFSGPAAFRTEAMAGRRGRGSAIGAFFSAVDYSLSSRLEANAMFSALRQGEATSRRFYLGLSWRRNWITLRAGLQSVNDNEGGRYEGVIQLHGLRAFVF